jgi:protocatechuate 3,4-dioxygenase beta subunit
MDDELTRRRLLGLGLTLPLAVAACGDGDREGGDAAAPGAPLARTPACDDGDHDETPEQTEGPYFLPGSPRRRNLRTDGIEGRPLLLTGRVLSADCRPRRRALIDFWQADGAGEYDNVGSRGRGHQFTDADGRFRLETVVPGLYPGRTRHLHVKVQPRGGEVLTTQLYFPGEARNREDGIFDDALLMRVTPAGAGRRARFDFVV